MPNTNIRKERLLWGKKLRCRGDTKCMKMKQNVRCCWMEMKQRYQKQLTHPVPNEFICLEIETS